MIVHAFSYNATSMPTTVLLGDSITQHGGDLVYGYASQIQRHFVRRMDVINRGFRRYDSRELLQFVDVIKATLPRVNTTVLFIGTNDARIHRKTGRVGQTPDQFIANIGKLATEIKSWHSDLILITPPVCQDRNTKPYVEALLKYAKSKGIPIVDIHTGWDPKKYTDDGVHPNEKGRMSSQES